MGDAAEVGSSSGAVAVESNSGHDESRGTGFTSFCGRVPFGGSRTGDAVSSEVEVGSGSGADAGEGSGVEDEVRRAGDA